MGREGFLVGLLLAACVLHDVVASQTASSVRLSRFLIVTDCGGFQEQEDFGGKMERTFWIVCLLLLLRIIFRSP